jgi:hypothetical protein
VNASKPSGEWNRVEIRCEGSRVTATLNGETVQDVDFSQDPELAHRLREGFIMLQDHGNRVAYRNVRLKEL